MNTPHPIPVDGLVPPPGCPAHGMAQSGLVRLPEITDPARTYEGLRRQYGPVAPVLLHGDIPAWMVLGYRENLEVMRTPKLFSRDSRRWNAFIENRVPAESPLMPMVGWQPLCVFADGAEHARLRGAIVDGLSQFNRRGMRKYVTHYTRQLVAGFAADGTADLVRNYAEPLPMLVVSRLLGMTPDKGPLLVEPTLDLVRGSETAAASNAVVTQVLQELVAYKRTAPGDDLASRLILHSSRLTDTEVIEHLRLTLVAAHQGTVNLIAHTLRLILTDRRFRGNLSGGHMTLPDALEQVMWDNPSIATIPGRWATSDTTIGGQHVRKGDLLMLCIAAANVDPEQRPDLGVPMHGNRSHLALSAGPHECPGGDIGRAIADTGIDELTSILPDMALAVPETEIGITSNWLTTRPDALPVRFTPPRSLGDLHPVNGAPPAAQPLPAAAAQGPLPARPPGAVAARRRSWWRSLLSR
ncbi:cytochrome P450 [Streptomyces tirandamycinicus]|uniref:Cytochrome n=1 Tax=Streptomyces tirandamycinicus TaxID=2174846 RepID=A0A2S1T273_9ACTN|nr:cytochrome P450 [Streptomyces tirandamycinicus]AWI32741.1 cytochrome [Streptomyces tirandamycinicus]